MTAEAPLLDVENLDVFYGEARALDGVSLKLARGEIVSVVGANGAGKTTLIRTLAGMLRPAGGTIRYGRADIAGWDSPEVGELGLAQVPEGRQIFPTLTVVDNLELGGVLRRARRDRRRNIDRVFTMFPRLRERRNQDAGTLSGGEQQMLAIGRCLMSNPECILFDEPSLGLAPALVEEVFSTVETLNGDGISILLVEQNVAESLELCHRAYVMENGRIVLEGEGKLLLDDDRIRQAYLGI